jgi:hypothetical protein
LYLIDLIGMRPNVDAFDKHAAVAGGEKKQLMIIDVFSRRFARVGANKERNPGGFRFYRPSFGIFGIFGKICTACEADFVSVRIFRENFPFTVGDHRFRGTDSARCRVAIKRDGIVAAEIQRYAKTHFFSRRVVPLLHQYRAAGGKIW